MDVRNWPMNQIMQLPDSCFGRRFLISAAVERIIAGACWNISEMGLPETAVIWEFRINHMTTVQTLNTIRVALGDTRPTAIGHMDGFEPLFHGLGAEGRSPRDIYCLGSVVYHYTRLRMPIFSGGRRMAIELIQPGEGITYVQVGLVVSSIPTEVPDWLCSGRV